METKEVKLLSLWVSGYGLRVQLALKAKGINFEYEEQDIINKSKLLVSSNPVYKRVPVLLHNGKSICESRLIIEYIDETWPEIPPLLPNDPYLRYLVRFWSDYMDKKHSERLVHLRRLRFVRGEDRCVVMRQLEAEYNEMILTMEPGIAELEQRGCLYDGKSLKYMDVIFAPWMAWFGPIEKLMGFKPIDNEKCPCLYKWVHNLMRNQVVNSTLPYGDKLMNYAKTAYGLE